MAESKKIKIKNKYKQNKKKPQYILNPRNDKHICILLALRSLRSSRTFISSGFWLLPLAPGSSLRPARPRGISPAPRPLPRCENEPCSLLQALALPLPPERPLPVPTHVSPSPPRPSGRLLPPLQQEVFQAPSRAPLLCYILHLGFSTSSSAATACSACNLYTPRGCFWKPRALASF